MADTDDTSPTPPSLLDSKEEIIAKYFAHLRGQRTNAYQAEQETGIPRKSFVRWARAGYIKIWNKQARQKSSDPFELDAADVAYCAFVHQQKKKQYGGNLSGVRLFDEHGDPFILKEPERSRRFGSRSKDANSK